MEERRTVTALVAGSSPALQATSKRCPKCTEHKPATLEFFYKGAKWRDGFKPYCKVCQKAQTSTWIKSNPEKRKLQQGRYFRKNIEKVRAKAARWRKNNPEKVTELKRRARRKGRENPSYVLSHRMRRRLLSGLKSTKGGRSWQEVLGYSVADLRRHLERQFQPGMTWENIGQWHIDHIVPVSSFKYQNENDPEFKACWALANLAPRWATENIRKNAKRIYLL